MRYVFGLLLFGIGCWGSASAQVNIGDVSVYFCHTTGALVKDSRFVVNANSEYPLCLEFINTSTNPVDLNFGFVDGELSNNGNKACDTAGGIMGKAVDFDTWTVSVPANSSLQRLGTLNFPLGVSGTVYGCLTYSLVEKQKQEAMFNVLVRKANFFEGLVQSDFKRGVSLGNISYRYDRVAQKVSVDVEVVNTGNVDEYVSLSGLVTNILGYQRDLIVEKTLLAYGSAVVLRASFDMLPFYKGLYDVNFVVNSQPPVPDLGIKNEELFVPHSFNGGIRVVVVPWGIVGGLLLVLVLVVVRRRKN